MAKPSSHFKTIQMDAMARLLATISCTLMIGCSGSGWPDTAPVRGQVTYRDKALRGAIVTFLCPGAPRLAIGTTDDQGNYELTTFEPNDGAVIGTHVVTVRQVARELEHSVDITHPVDSKSMSKAIDQARRQTAQQIERADTTSAIPSKYADRRTSGLSKEVVAGDNVINIDLTD